VSIGSVTADDGARLAVEALGPGQPAATVVLAHGWTLTRTSWRPVAELVRRARPDVRVVSYDQRDHGDSRPAPRGTGRSAPVASLARLADDLAAVVERLAPAGQLVLGGHSMGGMTIMCLAAARSELFGDRVRGVALVSTSAGDLAPAGETLAERMQLKLAPGLVTAAIGGARALERVRQLLPPTHRRHQKVVRDLLYGADATDDMVLTGAEIMHASTVRAFAAFYPALGEHDKRQELEALTDVPVEILVGADDKLTPQRHSRRLAEALPEAELHVVPRTGHMLPQERAALVTEAVERLLAAATIARAAA
jgi:pimeloyl-ACP methyl ester carboxylesterase